jgi:spore germination cell wall hydrolase CwlJ-like protein
MKARKFILCFLIAMSFTLGTTSIAAYAEETTNTATVDTSSNADDKSTENLNITESSEAVVGENKDTAEITKEETIEETKEDTKEDTKAASEPKKADKTDAKEKEVNYTKSELRLLSALIYSEAGNQSYKGKLAVANVVLNRADSDVFWHVDTIKEVIYDKKWGVQFSVIKKDGNGESAMDRALELYDTNKYLGNDEETNMEECIKAAKAALNGTNNIGDYLYFTVYNKSLADKYSDHVVIGAHIFYNTK